MSIAEKSFPRLLEHYIQESGYTNYEFAKIIGINRVNIQRYLAGSRVPSREVFETIMDCLHLGSWEQEQFLDSYHRAQDGDDFYYLRKCVQELLEKAGEYCGTESGYEQSGDMEPLMEVKILQGTASVEKYIWSKLTGIRKSGEKETVCCYVPADRYMLGRLFPTASMGNGEKSGLRIIQLVRLTKRLDMKKLDYHNLKVLANLIPAYYHLGEEYETYFYYHDLAADLDSGLLYPYYMLFKDQVVLFSEHMEEAVILPDRALAERFMERNREKYRSGSNHRLISCHTGAAKLLEHFAASDSGAAERYFLEYQPCFAEWADRRLLESVVPGNVPGREMLLDMVEKRINQLNETCEFFHYFTEEGVREFAESGVCTDYPEGLVRPFSPGERREILDKIIRSMEQGEGRTAIVNRRYLKLTRKLNIFVSNVDDVLLVLYDERVGFRYLQVKEPTICRAFTGYIRSMQEHGTVLSGEKSVEIIKKYRDGLCEQDGTLAGTY